MERASDRMFPESTDPEAEARRQTITRAINVLTHAIQCDVPSCLAVPQCQNMKQSLQHSVTCQEKALGTCTVCKNLIALYSYHAKFCQTADNCMIPLCSTIKGRLKHMQLRWLRQRLEAFSSAHGTNSDRGTNSDPGTISELYRQRIRTILDQVTALLIGTTAGDPFQQEVLAILNIEPLLRSFCESFKRKRRVDMLRQHLDRIQSQRWGRLRTTPSERRQSG